MKRIIMLAMVLVMMLASIGGCSPRWNKDGRDGGDGGQQSSRPSRNGITGFEAPSL